MLTFQFHLGDYHTQTYHSGSSALGRLPLSYISKLQIVEIRLLNISHIPGSECFRPQSPPGPASLSAGVWWS